MTLALPQPNRSSHLSLGHLQYRGQLNSFRVPAMTALLLLCSWLGAAALDTSSQAQAQSVDIKLDSSVSSGVMVGPNGREISMRRSPLLLDFDAAFIFDGDHSVEWVLGSLIQAEYTPGFAINPQVRLRRKWKLLEGFAGIGLPFFIQPYTRFGTELSFGASFPTGSPLAFVTQVNLQTYFWGSDLPDNHTVFTINGAVGVRMRF